MREIKFRAWHKREKKMYAVDSLDWVRDGAMIFYVGVQMPTTIRESSIGEYELMQYTGLKDSKNREVFEGDIVKINNKIYEVLWDVEMGFACFDREKKALELIYQAFYVLADPSEDDEKEVEVIGNTSENPELLNI